MSKEYATPLTLELKPSPVFKYYLLSLYLLAITAVVYADLHPLIQVFTVLFLVIFYFYQTSRTLRYTKIVWSSGNDWQLYELSLEGIEVHLTPMSFCSSWLVILAFKTEAGKRINITVPYDSLNAEIFRRLKVRLRIIKPKSLIEGDPDLTDEEL